MPVMVWFHGGGHTAGVGSATIFDGTAMAKKGRVDGDRQLSARSPRFPRASGPDVRVAAGLVRELRPPGPRRDARLGAGTTSPHSAAIRTTSLSLASPLGPGPCARAARVAVGARVVPEGDWGIPVAVSVRLGPICRRRVARRQTPRVTTWGWRLQPSLVSRVMGRVWPPRSGGYTGGRDGSADGGGPRRQHGGGRLGATGVGRRDFCPPASRTTWRSFLDHCPTKVRRSMRGCLSRLTTSSSPASGISTGGASRRPAGGVRGRDGVIHTNGRAGYRGRP